MKFNLSMLGLCVMFFLLSLVVGRSAGGVANPCKKGKFFDRLKQEYRPCHECKSETQECLTCCQLEVEAQGKMFSIKRYVLFAIMVYFCRFVGLGLILFHKQRNLVHSPGRPIQRLNNIYYLGFVRKWDVISRPFFRKN